MDILVKADWWSALEGSSVIADKELPPLSGVEDLIAADQSEGDLANTKNLPEANASDSPLFGQSTGTDSTPFPKGIVIAVVLFSGILLIGTFVLNKNRER